MKHKESITHLYLKGYNVLIILHYNIVSMRSKVPFACIMQKRAIKAFSVIWFLFSQLCPIIKYRFTHTHTFYYVMYIKKKTP